VQAISLAGVHVRTGDVNTVSAGRFPGVSATGDRHDSIEADRRSAKHLAEHITTLLREHNPENWPFAAPADINQPVLDQVEAGLRKQVVQNVPQNLVKVSPRPAGAFHGGEGGVRGRRLLELTASRFLAKANLELTPS
jgi:hypothetical protein